MEFLYDHTGVFAVKYNNATYFYRKDAQANIVALLDNNGSVVVKYKYDAWGKCNAVILDESATEIATLNPFRYRSYYYDTETNLYFLKTRYYDPEIGRFMTIDDISYLDPDSINGLNLYAYCLNNPVFAVDYNGNSLISILLILGLVSGAIIGATAGGIVAHNMAAGLDLPTDMVVGWTALGVVGGAAVGAIMGAAVGGLTGAAIEVVATGLSVLFNPMNPMLALASGGAIASGSAIAISSEVIGVGALAGIVGSGIMLFSKANTGPIRFNDGTGIDPETGKFVTDQKRAREIYQKLKDEKAKAHWKKWMKGKGWRTNHLKGIAFFVLAGEWLEILLSGDY